MSQTPQMRPGAATFGGVESAFTSNVVPARLVRTITARVDPLALGAALGIVTACLVFAGTSLLMLTGGDEVATNLSLLSNYWPGYQATLAGSLVGAMYGGMIGVALGLVVAFSGNAVMSRYRGGASAYR